MKEKILLLTDIPPCKNYTGGIMLSQMVRMVLEEKLDIEYYCIQDQNLAPILDTTVSDEIKLTIVDRPNEIFSKRNSKHNYYKKLKHVTTEVLNYINSGNFTKIWIVLQGEVMVNIAHEIMKNGYKYIVQIWDPIEWWAKEHYFSKERKSSVISKHDDVLKKASTCITTSKAMSKYYEKTLKTKCIEVMPPLKKYNFSNNLHKDDRFVIAMSGQVYAQEELEVLFSALDKLKWKNGDKDIYFEHYGEWHNAEEFINRHVEYKDRIICNGFVEQNQLLYYLSQKDILYCPYFFSDDETLKKVSELSFPSKLVTYLSLDVPVVMHGPKYASPVKFLEEKNAGYVIVTNEVEKVANELKKIFSCDSKKILNNAKTVFESNFTFACVKKQFFKALGCSYESGKKLRILEVNNVDLPGRRFNGYDLLEEINEHTDNQARQIVVYKTSDNKDVKTFYKSQRGISLDWALIDNESRELSVHSQLSLTSNILKNDDNFIHSDVVHYHLIHNTKLCLNQMIELCANKPSVLTLHDPWNFTGRCAYPQECEKWRTGCHNCEFLNNLFPFSVDNCHSLWNLKKKVYNKLDVDIVVSTPFMKKMLEESPLTSHFKNIHVIPFGMDLKQFDSNITKEEARKKLGLPQDDIILFFRAQLAMKGTEYIVEAMDMLETDKKITLLSCSEVGLLDSIKDKYNVVDMGNINNDKMLLAYNACDVFLMPSRGESFGLMAIEAMACSKPIIVFDNTSLPYVTFAPECGVLVENKNSKKLMEAIKWMVDDPAEREKRGKLGRKLAEEHYDIKVYHQKINKLYEDVYNRQKDKLVAYEEIQTDYELLDVKILIGRLRKIYKNMFHKEMDYKHFGSANAMSSSYDYIIDYSNDSVQNVIKEFNDIVYREYLDIEKSKSNKYTKTIFNLLRYDRPRLFSAIDRRLKNIPIVYQLYRIFYNILIFIYRILRRIKRFIFNSDIKETTKRITELEENLEKTFRQLQELQVENELLKKKIELMNAEIENKKKV